MCVVKYIFSNVTHVIFTAVGAGGELADNFDSEDGAQNWKKCQAMARIIGTCPAQVASVEEYYSSVCPQVSSFYPNCLICE